MTHTPVIAASILSADFAKLGQEVVDVVAAGADWIHFDVMDNHYVPNLTFGPMVCQALRPHTTAPIDVHLMVQPVDQLIESFAKAGASWITFHPEASTHVDRSLNLIHDLGCKAGLVLNPASPLTLIEEVLDKIDMVLLMSVNPGFGGQSYIPYVTDKARRAKVMLDRYAALTGRTIRLQIDGGVNANNIQSIHAAGVDTFVAGSAIFGQKNYAAAIEALRKNMIFET